VLQRTDDPAAAWIDVPEAVPPWLVPFERGRSFFRLRE
jgi:hypothetical protein